MSLKRRHFCTQSYWTQMIIKLTYLTPWRDPKKYYQHGWEWTWELWLRMDTAHSPDQKKWSLTIRSRLVSYSRNIGIKIKNIKILVWSIHGTMAITNFVIWETTNTTFVFQKIETIKWEDGEKSRSQIKFSKVYRRHEIMTTDWNWDREIGMSFSSKWNGLYFILE